MSLHADLELAAVAASQGGLVTRAQASAAGLSRRTIARRIASGLLVPAGARTLRPASVPLTDEVVVRAGALDHDAVVSHRAAAWKHGLMELGGVIDLTVAKGRSTHLAAADARTLRIHTSTNLPSDDIVTVDGFDITSIARTLFGLAALVPDEISPPQLLDVVSAAIEGRKASLAWLRWLLEARRCRGRNGVTAFAWALDARERLGPTESWLERRFITLADEAGLRRPQVQRRIARAPGRAARVDFLYGPERTVVEVLGYAFHRTPEQITRDTLRANELQIAGYVVLQLTSRLLDEDPATALGQVARSLTAGAPPLRRP